MTVLVKEPGKIAKVTEIDGSLESMQNIVDGFIEVVPFRMFEADCAVICNEEGRILNMPYNMSVDGIGLVGTLIFCGIDGEQFTDFPGVNEK